MWVSSASSQSVKKHEAFNFSNNVIEAQTVLNGGNRTLYPKKSAGADEGKEHKHNMATGVLRWSETEPTESVI